MNYTSCKTLVKSKFFSILIFMKVNNIYHLVKPSATFISWSCWSGSIKRNNFVKNWIWRLDCRICWNWLPQWCRRSFWNWKIYSQGWNKNSKKYWQLTWKNSSIKINLRVKFRWETDRIDWRQRCTKTFKTKKMFSYHRENHFFNIGYLKTLKGRLWRIGSNKW